MKKSILWALIKYNAKQVYRSNGPWVISDGAPVAITANYAWGLVKSNPLLFLLALWFFPKTLIVLLILDYCYSSKPALVSYYNFCSAVVWKLCCLAKMIWHSAQYALCCISDKFVKAQSKQGGGLSSADLSKRGGALDRGGVVYETVSEVGVPKP